MMSISQSPGYASNYCVTAYSAGDITRLFPDADVDRLSGKEKGFRAFIDKEVFIKRMIECMLDIEYTDMLQGIGPSLTRKTWYQATLTVALLAATAEAAVLSKMGKESVVLLDK